ncbi:putative DASH complex subunit Ask1-domain-containing protein [Seiridium unicorne]|uniref:DASH complex subunit ASK1 n=1 Tax=Seiridium unicorne TaxID=138068 RepID=A0ABR2UZU3_9PEZI
MSRPGPSRNLTLTEELEKLEQSITLTLQEIDHNFSKAHRIVTSSILPLVEQYGEHSKNVWEASKFWKQFFEASANVSLSGYEELANEADAARVTDADQTTQIIDTTTSDDYTPEDHEQDITGDQSAYEDRAQHRHVEDSLLDDGSLSGGTPRPPATKSMKTMQFADMDSPYETLRRELKSEAASARSHAFPPEVEEDEDEDTMQLPGMATQARLPDMSMTPRSSSMLEAPTPMQDRDAKGKSKDPLLHRVLDKNYRIQATPHRLSPVKLPVGRAAPFGGADDKDMTRRALWQDSPMSSPEIAAPTLRTNLYSAASPLKARGLARGRGDGPRTPGVSVQTPGTARKTRDVFAEEKGKGKRDPRDYDWSDDDDDDETDGVFGGMSPPKTIQFALPPSKLLQTPAREASKRIVDDILLTAGAAPQYLEEDEEYSPTMVKMSKDILEDSF